MHEIIHLSLSSLSNHVHAHLYNSQESYFVYSDADSAKSLVDPAVRFRPGREYTPRALVWDLKGGFGSLKHLVGSYNEGTGDTTSAWDKVQEIRQSPIRSSTYQQAMDQGQFDTLPTLDRRNTLYWSDYLRVYYQPNSLVTLNDWEVDPLKYPLGRPRGGSSAQQFKGFDNGVAQWDQAMVESDQEYLDRLFRPVLEQCDSLAGVNVMTQVDSSWGSFSAEILNVLVDDYIPKVSRYVWGLYDTDIDRFDDDSKVYKPKKMSMNDRLSRIRTTTALVEHSSLFIPLAPPKQSFLPNQTHPFDRDNYWLLAAAYSLPYESISVLSSLRGQSKRWSLADLETSLIRGSGRKIVSCVSTHEIGTKLTSVASQGLTFSSALCGIKSGEEYVFSKVGIVRPPNESSKIETAQTKQSDSRVPTIASGQSPWDLYAAPVPETIDPWASMDEENLLSQGTSSDDLTKIDCPQAFNSVSSFPPELVSHGSLFTGLTVSSATSTQLREMLTYVTRFDRDTDDREELKEVLGTYVEEYRHNYSDDELDI